MRDAPLRLLRSTVLLLLALAARAGALHHLMTAARTTGITPA
jgi:hypothetical protein